jgi:hypothetical protein
MSAYGCTKICGELTYWHLIHGCPGTETSSMGHQQLCHLHLKHRKKPCFHPAQGSENQGNEDSDQDLLRCISENSGIKLIPIGTRKVLYPGAMGDTGRPNGLGTSSGMPG